MKKVLIYSLLFTLIGFACSPKKGGQMATTDTAVTNGKGPVVPIPTGDVRKSAPKPGTAPKLQIGNADKFKLDNGLQVIVVENHKLPQVNFQIFVDADPMPEGDAAGYRDMAGQLLQTGTKTRIKSDIDKSVDYIGARLSSSQNGVSGSCLTRHSEKLLELMSDVLLNPTFPEKELEKLKVQQETALATEKDDPNAIASHVANVLRYGKTHPYGEITTSETLKKITRDQCQKFHADFFKPNISYLIITGDITHEKAEKYAKKYFGGWKMGDIAKVDIGEPRAPEKTMVDFVNKAGAVQSVIELTYPVALKTGDPDQIKANVLNTVLGGYFNSRLNANLREGHGWTYGSRSRINPDKFIGYFTANASVRNAVTDSSITQMIFEMNKLRTEKMDAKELSIVKNVMTGNFASSLEEPGTLALFALNMARYNLPADYYQKYLEVLSSVTPEEIQNLAKKYLRPDRAHILVVGNKEEVADKLKGFAADGKINFYDTEGNPEKAVTASVPAGMTAEKVLSDYTTAIGGEAKIKAIKDLTVVSLIKARGPEFTMKTQQKQSGKFFFEMTMNGQVLTRQITDGVAGKVEGMGGAAQELEGADLEDLKAQGELFKEAFYAAKGYKLSLKGIENVEGKNAYAIEVTDAKGKKWMEYYDMTTSLKIREVAQQDGGNGQMMTVQTDFSDYKAINGVLFPHVLDLVGVFPTPMKAVVQEIQANTNIDDAVFKVK